MNNNRPLFRPVRGIVEQVEPGNIYRFKLTYFSCLEPLSPRPDNHCKGGLEYNKLWYISSNCVDGIEATTKDVRSHRTGFPTVIAPVPDKIET